MASFTEVRSQVPTRCITWIQPSKAQASPLSLNRYTHVFLLTLFTTVAGSPLAGMQVYSAAAFASGFLLVYSCARYLTSNSGPANGTIAVGLFFGLPVIIGQLLAPNVDTTAMLIVLSFVAVYILAVRTSFAHPWHIVLLGLIFLLGLKAKETVLVAGLLLVGFGFGGSRWFDSRSFLRNLSYFAAGIASGLAFHLTLNALLLRNPLFGFNLGDLQKYIAEWTQLVPNQLGPANYLDGLLLTSAAIPFLLYVFSGLMRGEEIRPPIGLLWAIPLVLIAFLGITLVRSGWGTVPRYFTPGLAIICILAGYIAEVKVPAQKERKAAVVSLAIALVVIAAVGIYGITLRQGLIFPVYYDIVFTPVILALVIGLLLASRFQNLKLAYAVFICALALSIYSPRLNLGKSENVHELLRPNARFQGLLALDGKISKTPNFSMFVATSLLRSMSISNNRDEVSSVINVALNLDTVKGDFGVGTVDESFLSSLAMGDFEYVLVSADDWDWMRTAPQDRPEWRDRYSGSLIPQNSYVLLKIKTGAGDG